MTYFAYARTALKYGLLNLGFQSGDRILVPEYICDALLHPVIALGLQPVYYPIDDLFKPQWDALEDIVSGMQFRAIVMVHYFGQPQDIVRFRELCDRHRLLLIEDNAHGFGGMIHGKPLGTFGDIGISSPRKILNTATGGLLYINGMEQLPPASLQMYRMGLGERLLRYGFERCPRFKVRASILTRRLPNFDDPSAFHENLVHDYVADKKSAQTVSDMVATRSVQEMACRRRDRWIAWENMAKSINLQPAYDYVHPESAPWAFPAYIRSVKQRDHIVSRCLKSGIIIFPWPSLPSSIVRYNKNAVSRWHNLICIPLHLNIPRCFVI